MGQRHQIYIVLPHTIKIQKGYKDEEEEKERVDSNIFPIHHQWLFGFTACNMLAQFLTFTKNSLNGTYPVFKTDFHYKNNFNNTNEIRDLLLGLYSLNIDMGYYHSVCEITYAEAENPLCSDNNDGITVIDLRGDQPKYCMMYLRDAEKVKKGIPLPWKSYLNIYYTDGDIQEDKDSLQNFTELHTEMAGFELLSEEETRALFPKMYEEMDKVDRCEE